MKLRAFNLLPGLVIRRDAESVSVVSSIRHDTDLESVYGRYRSGEPFILDFNQEVDVVGVTIDHTDPDAGDFGNDEADQLKEV